MGGTFWFGILIGAIAGIVLEFLSRPLQRFLDRRLETRAQLRGDQLREQKVGNREAVRDFLVLQILETTLIGALAGIGSGALFAVGTLIPYTYAGIYQRIFTTAGQAVAIVGAILILRIAGDAISIARAAGARKNRTKAAEQPPAGSKS